MNRKNIFDCDFEELNQHVLDWGEPSYRTEQIWDGLYQQMWSKPSSYTTLSIPLREKLGEDFKLSSLTLDKSQFSQDGETTKLLYRLDDGAAIETVLMSYRDRHTVCISSQVGCAMGCDFCATGNLGFTRNLSTGEIVEQVIRAAERFQELGERLTNVVFMGMGEPFHNYQSVMKAVEILNNPVGFSFGARRITISTVGIVPGIKKFALENSQVNLAISLHAADDQLRSSFMPINKKYPISTLMDACQEYIDRTNRRISVEWALINGVNDSEDQAKKLIRYLKGGLFHVNLIRLNPVQHYPGNPSSTDQASVFQQLVLDAGIPCTFRVRRGIDIQAGCGQLASQRD